MSLVPFSRVCSISRFSPRQIPLSSLGVSRTGCRYQRALLTSPLNNQLSTMSAEVPPKTSKAAPMEARSNEEVAQLVQKRVKERDNWLVDGLPQEKASHTKDFGQFLSDVLPQYVLHKPPTKDFLDEHFPVKCIKNWEQLRNPPMDKIQLTWMGHASILIQVDGCTILTDPVFSQRCAPTQFSGPKRLRDPPCTIAELCHHLSIDVVLISHNHYDHLDTNTVRDIHRYSPSTSFVVPLGLKSWCLRNISKQAVIHELDWDEHVDYSYSPASTGSSNLGRQSIRINCVAMRHWSSRYGVDRDRTLWCGYSLATQPDDANAKSKKILFPGDTAWFDCMEDLVGIPYGPHDVAAIPIGAYEPREFMKRNHVDVNEAVKMKDAIRATNAVPIHWGTFALTVEPFLEPREVLQDLMEKREDAGSFEPWLIGETKVFEPAKNV